MTTNCCDWSLGDDLRGELKLYVSRSAWQVLSLFPFDSLSSQGGIHILGFIGSLLVCLEKHRKVRWEGGQQLCSYYYTVIRIQQFLHNSKK